MTENATLEVSKPHYQTVPEDIVNLAMRNIFKDMFKYFPSKLCGLAGNTIVIPIYTNLLSTEQYGIYTLSIAFLSFLCILFSDWVGLSGLRFFKHHQIKDEIPKYLSTLIGLLAFNISAMFIFAYIFRHQFCNFFKLSPEIFFSVLILIIPVAIRALFFQILRAQIKPIAFTISTIINQILTILISVTLIKMFHWGAYAMLLGMGVSITLVDILMFYQSNVKDYFQFTKPKFDILSTLFKYGVPLAITSLSLWGINQSNKIILNQIHTFKEVGLLGVGYGITFSILNTFFVVISIAAIPRIINLYEEKIDIRPIVSKLTGLYTLIALPLIIVYCLYSKDLVMLLANEKFYRAYILIPYLAFSAFFLSFSDYTTLQYSLSKKTYLNTIIRVISAIVGLALNVILIKKMGLLGLGIATLVGNVLYFLLSIFVTVPGLNWKIPYKRFYQIFLAFLPTSLVYYLLFRVHGKFAIAEMFLTLTIYYGFYFIIRNLTGKKTVM